MDIFLELTAELAAMLAALVLCFWLLLATRNPFRPRWIDKEPTSALLVMGVLSILIVAVAWFMKGLIGAGIDPLGALSLSAVVLAVMSWILWKGLHMKQRLDAAEAGRSPFSPGKDRIGPA